MRLVGVQTRRCKKSRKTTPVRSCARCAGHQPPATSHQPPATSTSAVQTRRCKKSRKTTPVRSCARCAGHQPPATSHYHLRRQAQDGWLLHEMVFMDFTTSSKEKHCCESWNLSVSSCFLGVALLILAIQPNWERPGHREAGTCT